ncbi:calmodulin calcium-dependent NAD kinase-like [Zingiber officinale]|uniref:calmodulin calcium-dependent NAD kinase-like n=1 Tax=Zingiber officinale TaxID=94328 RepID=UPI001C4CA86A|nr:calmodulin calcium-dependent NAD kinase-like [Zingiber officinale]
MRDSKVVPRLVLAESGRIEELESFQQYVARQLGFEDSRECPILCKLANGYLRRSNECEDNIFDFLSQEQEHESLYVKLVEELDKCILGYFAFHWSHAPFLITQVLSADHEHKMKLKNFVMEATRNIRFERVAKDLKVTRVFSTLVEELKAIGIIHQEEFRRSEVVLPAPADASEYRSPVLLLMGGGMGAGKSTVLKEILKDPFWLAAAASTVVVEADQFKEMDVIYKAISSRGNHSDMLQTAELVHQSSTDAASSLLVTALNEGRDVIMDGTLSWEPFVRQTITMARNVHLQQYRMGVGYKVSGDGTVTENYWEPVVQQEEHKSPQRKPYRIELVGVICDAYLAVVRGVRRAIIMGRAVRVQSQLKSHKRFASAFPRYCRLADSAKLYSTNSMGSAKMTEWRDGSRNLPEDRDCINCLEKVSKLNEDADSIYELYPEDDTGHGSGSIWDEITSPARAETQQQLKEAVKIMERSLV